MARSGAAAAVAEQAVLQLASVLQHYKESPGWQGDRPNSATGRCEFDPIKSTHQRLASR
jgi:hypothetical protein